MDVLVILAFVLPAALFSLCGFMAWLRMWNLGRRREKKVFDQLEEQVRHRIEEHRRSILMEELSSGYTRPSSAPMIQINEQETDFYQHRPSVLFV
ncbi:hypothetical protein M3Y97_00858400 [Aphelenchoides bicaudatus]|nr:hypothetical protein M3Y97_00858400 [Aphelenchoides bicaudatus]